MERLVVTVNDNTIGVADIPDEIVTRGQVVSSEVRSLADAAETAEKKPIQAALVANDFHREKTANSLEVSVRTLHYKMNRYGLH
jgi:two-component system NtrC family response regulator